MKKLYLFLILFTSLYAEQMDIRIPVVDMKDYYDEKTRPQFLNTLFDAMTTVGFFAVRNTGVDVDVVKNAYLQSEHFFLSDMEYKLECFAPEFNGQRGFVPGEVAKGNTQKDKKEFYHIGKEGSIPQNIWPKDSSFEHDLKTLFSELEKYVVPLQEAIVATINQHANADLPLDLLNIETKEGNSLLRALYYLPLNKDELDLQKPVFWAAPHTDIDLLAILPYATAKGLQVEIDGEWLNVVVPSDAFVVNVGDMLENLTNGLFVSAKHQVVAQEVDQPRFSMVLFVHPKDTTSLQPLDACIKLTGGKQLYAPGTRLEFLWERLLELNLAPALLEPYSKMGHVERQIQYGRQSPQVVRMLIEQGLASPAVLESVQ